MSVLIRFTLTPPPEALLGQVSQILEAHTLHRSRAKYPGLWAVTDRLNEDKPLRSRRASRRPLRAALGIALFLGGLVLLLPGLQSPGTIPAAVPVGLAAWVLGMASLWRSQRTVLMALSLVVGCVLTLGAALDFSALGCFLAPGLAALAVGILTPVLARYKRPDRFARGAAQLLAQLREKLPAEVTFTEEGMQLPDGSQLSFAELTCAVESADLLALIWGEQIILLQKKDLAEGDYPTLWALLEAAAPLYFI